jgi:nucleoid DNA-binding protein
MSKPLTKTQLVGELMDQTRLEKKEVQRVLDALEATIATEIATTGVFQLPGLLKIQKVLKPAKPERKGVPNPFKPGELMDIKAKPAKSVIKVRPMKKLKDMALL